jgi:hypothetical protein
VVYRAGASAIGASSSASAIGASTSASAIGASTSARTTESDSSARAIEASSAGTTGAGTSAPTTGAGSGGRTSQAGGRASTIQATGGASSVESGRGASAIEHRARLADVPSGGKRALLVADVFPSNAPLSLDAAVALSRTLFPNDTQPRDAGPEGNQRFVVERFTSPNLALAFPPEWFADRQAQPGDFIVVYARRSDGHIAYFAISVGDDAEGVLSQFKDVAGV